MSTVAAVGEGRGAAGMEDGVTTIETMTASSDATDGEAPDGGEVASAPARGRGGEAASASAGSAAARRSLLVPVLTTVVGALVGGVLLLAVVGFNVLRDEIGGLRSEMRAEIGGLRDELRSEMRAEIGGLRDEMTRRFEAVDSALLDHTDRLARIETHLGIGAAPDAPAQP